MTTFLSLNDIYQHFGQGAFEPVSIFSLEENLFPVIRPTFRNSMTDEEWDNISDELVDEINFEFTKKMMEESEQLPSIIPVADYPIDNLVLVFDNENNTLTYELYKDGQPLKFQVQS